MTKVEQNPALERKGTEGERGRKGGEESWFASGMRLKLLRRNDARRRKEFELRSKWSLKDRTKKGKRGEMKLKANRRGRREARRTLLPEGDRREGLEREREDIPSSERNLK